MSYGTNHPYTAPPPPYDEEAGQPLLGEQDDMFKDTVANSSKEVRLGKAPFFFIYYFA
jgi:hypothetical protein